jgi:hypothetical protein
MEQPHRIKDHDPHGTPLNRDAQGLIMRISGDDGCGSSFADCCTFKKAKD